MRTAGRRLRVGAALNSLNDPLAKFGGGKENRSRQFVVCNCFFFFPDFRNGDGPAATSSASATGSNGTHTGVSFSLQEPAPAAFLEPPLWHRRPSWALQTHISANATLYAVSRFRHFWGPARFSLYWPLPALLLYLNPFRKPALQLPLKLSRVGRRNFSKSLSPSGTGSQLSDKSTESS